MPRASCWAVWQAPEEASDHGRNLFTSPNLSPSRREMTFFYLFSCFWNGSFFFPSLSGSDPSPSLLCDLPFLHV